MEEIPEDAWKISSFALWTKGDDEAEYREVATFSQKETKERKGKERVGRLVRLVLRTFAQISLFFTCFLPLGSFLGNLLEHLVKN